MSKKEILVSLSFGLGILGAFYLWRKRNQRLKNVKLLSHSSKGNLTEEMAKERRNLIKGNVEYTLFLELFKGEDYKGKVIIEFETNICQTLQLDFEGSILSLKANGSEISHFKNRIPFIEIPGKFLQSNAKNRIEVEFENKYRNDGNGLHSFIDTDNVQYVFSNGEPFHIHKMFPCFDQPNIKGTFKLEVLSPDTWTVISNESIDSEKEQGLEKLTIFKPTPLLPPYLYTVVAGHFEKITQNHTYKNIPISFYCRKSLLPHLKQINSKWIQVTNKCLEFFENFFSVDYPFSKYDCVFCPECNFSAMENPGCVIFSDTYHIPKGKVTRDKISRSFVTIAHEMAHMWFGNLVTMQWWDDLWLNESFADFIGFFALQNIELDFETSNFERAFFVRKQWGYKEDQQSTTHPIAGRVKDTEEADSIFDGITYSKGAAVLRQLLCLMGPENFSRSCYDYFKKYKWSNTTLQNFLDCLRPYFVGGISLKEWESQWISQAGLNCIVPVWNSNTNMLIIHQTPVLPEFPTLRYHKLKLGIFDENIKIHVIDVVVQPSKITEFCLENLGFSPQAFLLNYKDESFVKVRLDEMSLHFFKTNISRVEDELTQTMIWKFLYDMVRDAKLSSKAYINLVLENVEPETQLNFSLIDEILTNAELSISAWTPENKKEELASKMFELTKILLLNTDPMDINRILVLKAKLIQFARSVQHVNKILDWHLGKDEELIQFELRVQDSWAIVRKVSVERTIARKMKEDLICDMLTKDLSEEGVLNAKEFSLLFSDEETRQKEMTDLLNPKSKVSIYSLQAILSGLNESHVLTKTVVLKYFSAVNTICKTHSLEFAKNFLELMFPNNFKDIEFVLQNALKTLEESNSEDFVVRRILKENIENLERKKAAFKAFEVNFL